MSQGRYQISCGIYGCGKLTDITKEQFDKGILYYCKHCNTPTWPMYMGFTGNSREDCIEYDKENPISVGDYR